MGEMAGDFAVDERQQVRALVDDGHAHAEGCEDRRVLEADHAGSHHRYGARQFFQRQDVVADQDALAVERDRLVARRHGAHGDNDLACGAIARAAPGRVFHAHGVRIDELGAADGELDLVALKLVACDVDLVADDVVGAEVQVRHGDVLLDRVARSVDAALAVPGQVHHRFAQRLRRDGAGVDADAADNLLAFDDQHTAAQLGGLNCGALARRARTNHHQIEVISRHRIPQGPEPLRTMLERT